MTQTKAPPPKWVDYLRQQREQMRQQMQDQEHDEDEHSAPDHALEDDDRSPESVPRDEFTQAVKEQLTLAPPVPPPPSVPAKEELYDAVEEPEPTATGVTKKRGLWD